MNILFLCDEYPPGHHGGIGTAVQLLARTLAAQGHRVVVTGLYDWGYGELDRFEDRGVLVYRFRQVLDTRLLRDKKSVAVRAALRLMKVTGVLQWDVDRSLKRYGRFVNALIAEHRIDLVEMPDFQSYMGSCLRAVHLPMLAAPTIVKLHGSTTYFAKEAGQSVPEHVYAMDRELLCRADAVTSVSHYTARMTARYMEYTRPIHVLHNGIDIPDLPPVANEHGRVVFSGSLIEKKGIYQLIKAWNLVHRQLPAARLAVYGKGPTEQIAGLLEPTARQSVHFHGHIDRTALQSKLAAASLAVFPSYAECFALAPMEAMAMGTAIIYSTRTSGPELIAHGENGYLCDPDDVQELARQIVELLQDDESRARLAQAGQTHVRERFSMHRIAEDHIEWYQRVLAQGRQPGLPVHRTGSDG